MDTRQDFGPHWEIAARSIVSPLARTLPENQDNFLLIDTRGLARYLQDHDNHYVQAGQWRPGHIRVAVMDGIGGHDQGRQVAEATARGLVEIPPATTLEALSGALDELHLRLQADHAHYLSPPGCTLTLLEIPADGPALLFHAGDSRLYEIGQEEVRCLTLDHVPLLRGALRGHVNEEQWTMGVHQAPGNEIVQAFVLGGDLLDEEIPDDRHPLQAVDDSRLPEFLRGLGDRRQLDLAPGRTYLLGTDGLWARPYPQEFIATWPQKFTDPATELQQQLDDLFFDLIIDYENSLEVDYRKDPNARPWHVDNCTAVAIRRKGEGA